MKTISHILILAFIVSIYVSYCQLRASYYYALTATMEKQSDWPKMTVFAIKASKAISLDDKPLHLLSQALLKQGHLEPAISLMKKALTVRPYKKYLHHNLKLARENLKSVQGKK